MPPYRTFPYKGFGGGLNLRDSSDVVGEDQAIDALNVLFTQRGAVQQRSGYARFTSAEGTNRYDSLAAFYKADGTKQLIAGAGNRLEALSSGGAILASSTSPTASPHFFERFGGPTAELMFIANGTDTVRQWNGAAFSTPTYTGVTPDGKFLGLSVTDNRLVVARFNGTSAGDNPSTVRFSHEGDPLSFDTDDYVDLNPGDGEQIMGVATWRDLVIVFKQTKFYVFYGNSVDDEGDPQFNYRPVDAGVGLASSRALATSEQGIYFLDRTGIYFTAGQQPSRVSDIVEPVFHGNPELYYTGGILNDGSVTEATMVYHDERLWFSFPSGTSGTNDKQLVFDPHEKWWSLTDLPAGPMCNFRPGNVEELCFGYSQAPIDQFLDTFASDSIAAGVFVYDGGSGLSVSGGEIVPTSTAQKRLYRAGSFGLDDRTLSFKITTGATTTSMVMRNIIKSLDETMEDYIYVAFSSANLIIGKRDVGALSNLNTTAFVPATGTSYWLRGRIEGNAILAEVFNNADLAPGHLITSVSHTLAGADATKFGVGVTGGDGFEVLPSDLNFRYDDYTVNVLSKHIGRYVEGTYTADHMTQGGAGGTAISSFWQGGWFNYETPLVKTIRELKLAGTGLVTVSMFRDYRTNAAYSVEKQLSGVGFLYDSGVLWDSGQLWGPSSTITPKAVRRAIRGEAFSLRFSNSTINRTFKVHRLTTHIREARVPSVVKVA